MPRSELIMIRSALQREQQILWNNCTAWKLYLGPVISYYTYTCLCFFSFQLGLSLSDHYHIMVENFTREKGLSNL